MANEGMGRRLTAILAADIADYSRLMGTDEARTVRDLKAHQAVLLPMVSDFGGRIIDTAGDGILAEFASAVQAIECALAVQNTMAERNATVDQARRMRFRIGVNIGDVICDESVQRHWSLYRQLTNCAHPVFHVIGAGKLAGFDRVNIDRHEFE